MKLIASILLCITLATSGSAQQNIFDSLKIPTQFYSFPGVHEHKECLYSVSYIANDSLFNPLYQGVYPVMYQLTKTRLSNYDAMSVTICGDTVQIDSSLPFVQPLIEVKDDRIHMAYIKRLLLDNTVFPIYKRFGWGLYYKQLDTNLSEVINETRLLFVDNVSKLAGLVLQQMYVGKAVTISFYQSDTSISQSSLSRYVQLDLGGNVIRRDTLGSPTISMQSPYHRVAEIMEYPGKKYLISGEHLYLMSNGATRMFYLADSAMNMIDTFGLKPTFFYNPPDVSGYFTRFPNLVALPSGSVIAGGDYSYSPSGSTHTGLVKCSPASRFKINKLVTFKNIDAADAGHRSSPSFHNLVYNSFDNLVYYANVTHSAPLGPCYAPENYLQVVCLDTNLNLKWRKLVLPYANGCSFVGYLEACDNRPGVIIAGGTYLTPPTGQLDTPKGFVYHLDSTIIADIDEPFSQGMATIKIFPNPTEDFIKIDGSQQQSGSISLTDVTGACVFKGIWREKTEISLGKFAAGIYFLRLTFSNGEVYNAKVIKR